MKVLCAAQVTVHSFIFCHCISPCIYRDHASDLNFTSWFPFQHIVYLSQFLPTGLCIVFLVLLVICSLSVISCHPNLSICVFRISVYLFCTSLRRHHAGIGCIFLLGALTSAVVIECPF